MLYSFGIAVCSIHCDTSPMTHPQIKRYTAYEMFQSSQSIQSRCNEKHLWSKGHTLFPSCWQVSHTSRVTKQIYDFIIMKKKKHHPILCPWGICCFDPSSLSISPFLQHWCQLFLWSAKCPDAGPHLGMICLGCIYIYLYIYIYNIKCIWLLEEHVCLVGGFPTIWCWRCWQCCLGQLQRLRIVG